MTSMHQSHHIQTYSTQNLDNNLDALLDDLQTSVSRPGTSMALSTKDNMMLNGGSFGGRHVSLPPGTSGYREITTTVTHETNGIPVTSREYQIEYLNPANSITVAKERSSSPGIDYLQKSSESSRNLSSSYKTESYGYRYEEKSSDGRYSRSQPTTEEIKSYSIENKPFPRDDSKNRNQSYQYSKSEDHRSENTNASKNLNDLENLLRELNDEPQPGMTSTPNVIRREERMSSRTLDTRSPARYEDSSNTIPKRSASANREVTYSEVINQRSDRAQSPYTPGTPKLQQRVIQRESQEYRGHTSRRDGSGGRDRSSEMSPTLRRRTPSPSREFRPSTFSSYPLSPKDTQRTVVTKSYNYSTSSARRTPTPSTQSFDEPQPYRSPSPVSFPQKRSPSPARKSLNRSDSGRNASYQVSSALSDPNSPTVITYKYTSQSSQHSKYPGGTYDDPDPSASRPLPSITPAPVEEQNPPKKLDDLMASFQEPRQMSSYEYSTSSERQNVDLQRSPSSERNVRPSDVRVSQTYSQSQLMQQQQQSPHHSHHHHHHHHHKHHEHHERHHHHQQQMPPQQHYQQQQYQQQYQQQQQQQQQESYAQQQYRQQQQQQQQESYAQQQYQQYQQFQQQQQHIPPQSPVNEVIPAPGSPIQGLRSGVSSSAAASNSLAVANSTKSVPGPPVYYPPGVELFTKKEEAMEQYGSKGKMKGKGKMKYKYESKEKSKEKSGSGVTAVPLCLPVCCAAPCVIM